MSRYPIRSISSFTCLASALALAACGGGSGGTGSASDTDDGIGSASANETGTGSGSADTSAGPDSQTDGGTADETAGNDDFSCGEVEVQLDAAPGRLMLVLDKSGSMVNANNVWDHDDDPGTDPVTRWFSLHAVVDNITSAFDAEIEFGMLLYPSLAATNQYNATACVVESEPEVPVAPFNAQAIMAAMPDADATTAIRGGTPSRSAVEVALDHLRTFDAGIPRAILFITDGEANCSPDADTEFDRFEQYDDALHTVVEDAWQTEAIPTYVVGIAIRDEILPSTPANGNPNDINPHEMLNELADQGGKGRAGDVKYYRTENEIELQLALEEIAAEQVSCVVELDPPPDHPLFVTVEINGEEIPRVDDCATEDGWVFHEPDEADGPYTHIELCGAACDQLVTVGAVDATYGCPPPG